jgi:hypothetical protein
MLRAPRRRQRARVGTPISGRRSGSLRSRSSLLPRHNRFQAELRAPGRAHLCPHPRQRSRVYSGISLSLQAQGLPLLAVPAAVALRVAASSLRPPPRCRQLQPRMLRTLVGAVRRRSPYRRQRRPEAQPRRGSPVALLRRCSLQWRRQWRLLTPTTAAAAAGSSSRGLRSTGDFTQRPPRPPLRATLLHRGPLPPARSLRSWEDRGSTLLPLLPAAGAPTGTTRFCRSLLAAAAAGGGEAAGPLRQGQGEQQQASHLPG